MIGLRPVRGDGSGERNAVCFRLLSDKDIVSHENVFMSLADYFHFLSATKGVAEVELMNHVMKQKTYPETPAAVPPLCDDCLTVIALCFLKRFLIVIFDHFSECEAPDPFDSYYVACS